MYLPRRSSERSSGFECLLGWLYLNGQLERVHQLFEVLWQQFDPDQK